MSALEAQSEASKDELTFINPKDKKIWNFKKTSDGVIFFIGDEKKGAVTKIVANDNDRTITVHISTDTSTVRLASRMEHRREADKLGALFGKLVERILQDPSILVLMLAAMNGRCNFDFYSPLMVRECPEDSEEITRDTLLKMLKRENELRLSKDTLEALEMEARALEEKKNFGTGSKNDILCNTIYIPRSIVECQEKVANEFGYKTNEAMNYALQMLRSARALFPDDVEINNATFYLKYNRAHRGELKVGDMYKDVSLMTCGEEEKRLSEIINNKNPTVIISGSVT